MAHTVATTDELPPGERLFVRIGNMEIAVLNVDGEYYAVRNFCPHMEGPVGRGPTGRDEDGNPTIRCPFHDWRFSLETGETYMKNKEQLATFEVTVEDGEIRVDV